MRPSALILATFAATSAATHVAPRVEPPASEPKAPLISLSELSDRSVAGRLGLRLGTIVEVSGVVIENSSRAKVDAGEPFFLRIDVVAGKKLVEPQHFSSSAMTLVREIPSLKVGDAFTCVGFEQGSFRGSPEGEFNHRPLSATVAFGFRVEFVVLKPRA